MSIQLLYVTTGSKEEAQQIGQKLVSAHLAACVNILDGMTSIYRWQDKLQEDHEAVMIVKTTAERVADTIAKIKALHSYECPCVLSISITQGHQPFLDWIAGEVRP